MPTIDTFPKLLARNAGVRGKRLAMRHKDFGIWQSWSWEEVNATARALAAGLDSLGIARGDKIAVIGANRPELYWAMAAAQALGAVPVPVYADSVAEEMAYVLDHADARHAIVEDQEQVDKILSCSERLPQLKEILYVEKRGLRSYDHSRIHALEAILEVGRQRLAADDQAVRKLEEGIAAGKGGDIAVILYTSGTTGRPKGVMLSYDNLLAAAKIGNGCDGLTEDDEVLAYLPMAWIGDHVFSYAQAILAGYCVNCPEKAETVIQDRREIGATYAFAPPRVFENLLTLTLVRMENAGRPKRWMFRHFIDVARRWGEKILNRDSVPFLARAHYALGELLVYAPLRNRYGFSRLKAAYTAGEAIGPDTFRFFRAIGINLKQLYGQTEASVYVTIQSDDEVRADTVGRPAPAVEIRIAPSGEVEFKSPGAFLGYYKDPQATADIKSPDGYVRTGDAGFLDRSGHLRIVDRAKDVGRLSDGSLFAPKYIENKLKFYPSIKEAVVFGDARDYGVCFINIDPVALADWADRNTIVYASYQELAAHPRVYDMIESHVEEVNSALAIEPRMAGAQIRRFLILPKELDADDGELTRTQKIRRRVIGERYEPLIRALYDGSEEADFAMQVTFEDGRKGAIEGRVPIRQMTHRKAAA